MNDIIHIFPINVFATILLVVIFAFLFYFLFIKIPKYIQAKKSPNATNFRQMITDF
ncbi:MAG: hypothetical protein LBF15_05335 [Candidatus Peribacteria bacterium]|nr:hypothetical protein [Candidatus Peribacteria bacterium]